MMRAWSRVGLSVVLRHPFRFLGVITGACTSITTSMKFPLHLIHHFLYLS